jgi:threonine-phosphate decarboxylase
MLHQTPTTQTTHGGNVWLHANSRKLKNGSFLDFSSNVNPLGPPKKALRALRESLWRITYYPEPDSQTLREAIAEKNPGIEPENIVVGNGATELIFLHAHAFLREGDQALTPTPTFTEYRRAAEAAGCRVKSIPIGPQWKLKADTILEGVEPNTKIIYLCNPNNPTGKATPKEEMLKMLEDAEERGVYTVVDESFMDMVDGEKRYSTLTLVERFERLFVVKSLTKIFCLPGLRLGYGAGSKPIADEVMRVKPPWNVNCLAQEAVKEALKDRRYLLKTRETLRRERRHLFEALSKTTRLKVYDSDVNFFLADARETGYTSQALKLKLLKHNILIRDCGDFEGLDPYFIRISVRSRAENDALIKALRKIAGG